MKNGPIKEPSPEVEATVQMTEGMIDIKVDNRSGFVVDVQITGRENVGLDVYLQPKKSRIKALLCKVLRHRWTELRLSTLSGSSTTLVCKFCRTQKIADWPIEESSK